MFMLASPLLLLLSCCPPGLLSSEKSSLVVGFVEVTSLFESVARRGEGSTAAILVQYAQMREYVG